jgi:hypothetical protein
MFREVVFQLADRPLARHPPCPEIKDEAGIAHSRAAEGGRGNIVICQIDFDPFQ